MWCESAPAFPMSVAKAHASVSAKVPPKAREGRCGAIRKYTGR